MQLFLLRNSHLPGSYSGTAKPAYCFTSTGVPVEHVGADVGRRIGKQTTVEYLLLLGVKRVRIIRNGPVLHPYFVTYFEGVKVQLHIPDVIAIHQLVFGDDQVLRLAEQGVVLINLEPVIVAYAGRLWSEVM